MSVSVEDIHWQQDGDRNGWVLPPKAAWPLRLWGIRHARAAVLNQRVHEHARAFGLAGIGFGIPNPFDLWVIYAIWRGWC